VLFTVNFAIFVQVHPDLNPGDPNNHVNFVKLNEAYTVLSNSTSRRAYDFQLQHADHVQTTAQSYSSAGTSPRHQSYHRYVNTLVPSRPLGLSLITGMLTL